MFVVQIGYKSSLRSSKSISDLSNIPEKDNTFMSLGPSGGSPSNTTAPGNAELASVRHAGHTFTNTGVSCVTNLCNSSNVGYAAVPCVANPSKCNAGFIQNNPMESACPPRSQLLIPLPPTQAGDPLHFALTGKVSVSLQDCVTHCRCCQARPPPVNQCNNTLQHSCQADRINDPCTGAIQRCGNCHITRLTDDILTSSHEQLCKNTPYNRNQRSASFVEPSLNFDRPPITIMSSSVHGSVFDTQLDLNNSMTRSLHSTSTLPDVVHGSPCAESIPSFTISEHHPPFSSSPGMFTDHRCPFASHASGEQTVASASFRLHPERGSYCSSDVLVVTDVGGAVFDDTNVPKEHRKSGQLLLAKLEQDLREFERLMYGALVSNVEDSEDTKYDLDLSTSQIIMEEDYNDNNNSDADTVKSLETNYSYDSLDDESENDEDCNEDNMANVKNSVSSAEVDGEQSEDENDVSNNDVFDSISEVTDETSRPSTSHSSAGAPNCAPTPTRPALPRSLPSERRQRETWHRHSLEPDTPDSADMSHRKLSSSLSESGVPRSDSSDLLLSGVTRSDSSDLQTPTNPPFFSVASPTASEPPTVNFRAAARAGNYTSTGVLKKHSRSKVSAVEKHCSFSINNSPTSPLPLSTPTTPSTSRGNTLPSLDDLPSRHHSLSSSFCGHSSNSSQWRGGSPFQWSGDERSDAPRLCPRLAALLPRVSTSPYRGSQLPSGVVTAVSRHLSHTAPHHSSVPDFLHSACEPSNTSTLHKLQGKRKAHVHTNHVRCVPCILVSSSHLLPNCYVHLSCSVAVYLTCADGHSQ